MTIVIGCIDGTVVGGSSELKMRTKKYAIYVLFPKASGFGMTLEGVLYRKNKRVVKCDVELMLIPVNVSVIEGNEGRALRRGRMSVGISGVASIKFIAASSSEGKE